MVNFRQGLRLAWGLALTLGLGLARAETLMFPLDGAEVRLARQTDFAAVFFRAMRPNRVQGTWNVDVLVRNTGTRRLVAPLVLRVEQLVNLGEVRESTGLDAEGKAFLDLSGKVPPGGLAAGGELASFTLTLGRVQGTPALTAAVFAPGTDNTAPSLVTRTLDETGLPLEGVQSGGARSGRGGWITVTPAPEARWVRFDAPGRLPVFRLVPADAGVTELPPPRLTRRAETDSIVGGISARFTPLTPQTLTAPLPLGWSPIAAAVVEFASEPGAPVPAEFTPLAAVAPAESVGLVRWEATRLAWEVVSLVMGQGTNPVPVRLPGSGSFALVVPDPGVPVALAGQVLPASPLVPPPGETWRANGTVTPASRPASPVPELVTTAARVGFHSAESALPSGVALRCAVREEYQLRDGSRRVPPRYETFITGYQRPDDAGTGGLTACFPLRPLLLLPGEELSEAKVTVEVLTPGRFAGQLLTPDGGSLIDGNVRFLAGADVFATPQAAQLMVLSPADFAGVSTGGQPVVAAFELGLAGVRAGQRLTPGFAPLLPDANYVLARTVFTEGLYGLQPVQRLASDSMGRLTSTEPATGGRLPGIDGGGQYLLVQAAAPSALVGGMVRDRTGQPASGLAVRAGPWLSFSDVNGRYQLLAPAGPAEVAVFDPRNGDTGGVTAAIAPTLAAAFADLEAAARGPRVVSVSPAAGAVNVARVTAVTLNFSRPLNPATLRGDAVQFTDANNEVVAIRATLNLAHTVLTLLPMAQLPASAVLQVTLAATLTDTTGLALEGPREFRFTTESDVRRRAEATLVISEPLNGLAPMVGGPGLAEPDSPVILVNETTGFTSTVLSKSDGSFTNNIPADVDDFLSAVIVNRNGTRNTLPASRQNFRDGSVGLYGGGGMIRSTGEGPPVDFIADPGAIHGKTVFKLESIPTNTFSDLVGGRLPEGAGPILGSFVLTESGDPLTAAGDISLPFKLASLGLAPGTDPTNFVFVVVMPLTIEGRLVHQIVDTAAYEVDGPEGGRLRTQSPPFVGMLSRKLAGLAASAGLTPITPVRVANDGDNPHQGETAAFGILALFNRGPLKVGGFVRSETVNQDGSKSLQPVAGATVRVLRAQDEVDSSAPGLVNEGELVSISDATGNFGFLFRPAEATTTRALVATHPGFPFQRARSGGFSGERQGTSVATAELRFVEVPPDLTALDGSAPPSVSVGHEPDLPVAGTNVSQGATVFVTALDDKLVRSTELKIQRAESLTGEGLALDEAILTRLEGAADAPGRQVRQFRLQLARPGRVTLEATAVDNLGQVKTALHAVSFGVTRPAVPPGDPNDLASLRVIFAWPPTGASNLPPLTPIRLRFNRALPAAVLRADQLGWLTFEQPHSVRRVEASADRRDLTVFYDGKPAGPVRLTVGPGVSGESGKPFDQNVTESGAQSFVMDFVQGTGVEIQLDGASGAGVVLLGRYAYALERPEGRGALRVFDLHIPEQPEELQSVRLHYPTAMALIPGYSLPGAAGGCESQNLLALFTGQANEPKFLELGRLHEGRVTLGQRLVLSGGRTDAAGRSVAANVTTAGSLSQVIKARWDAPYLGYLELGADVTSIQLLNLTSFQRVALAGGSLDTFPLHGGNDGTDANQDGDYCDAGDKLPVPDGDPLRPPGLAFSFAPRIRAERIEDFDFHAGLGLVVSISKFSDASQPPRFSTLLTAGDTNRLDGAIVNFTAGDSLRRVLLLPGTLLETSTNRVNRDLALVSIGQTSGDGALAVVDLTIPSAPILLNRFSMPAGEGTPSGIQRRTDGLLAVATSRSTLLFDPGKLLLPGTGSTHPGLVGRIDGLGTGTRDSVTDASGINWVHGGASRHYLETAPRFSFVRFNALLNPAVVAAQPAPTVEGFLRTASPVVVADILNAGIGGTAPPPDPSRHYYVLVDAPGGAADEQGHLPLVLAAVDLNGQPQPERGGTVVPAVVGDEQLNGALLGRRVIDLLFSVINLQKSAGKVTEAAGLIAKVKAAYGSAKSIKKAIDKLRTLGTALALMPEDFVAQRLSKDPDSPLFNRFLAGPFVVLGGAPAVEQLAALQRQAAQLEVDRAYLRAAPRLWVGLPSERQKGFLQFLRLGDTGPSKLLPFVSELRLNPNLKFQGVTIPGSTALIQQLARLNQLPGNPTGGFFDLGEQVTLIVGLLNNLPVVGKVVSGDWKPMLMPGAHTLLHVNYADRPMVLVPGFAGSKLEIEGKNEWVSLSLFEGAREQWRLRVDTDGNPVLPTFATDALRFGLETPIGNFRSIYADWIGHLTGEMGLVEYDFLKGGPGGETIRKRLRFDGEPVQGQSPAPNLFVFPYDWRLDNQQSAEQLRDYVRLALELNPDADGVDLVGHSNGGLVARAFMLLPGQRSLVKRFITVGTPWLGAPKILAGLRTGDMNETGINIITPIASVRQMLQFAPGAHQLLPTQEYFDLGFRPLVEDGFDINTNGLANESFTFDGFMDTVAKHFLRAPAIETGRELLGRRFADNFRFEDLPGGEHPARRNTRRFHAQAIADHRQDPPDVETHHIFGLSTSPDTIGQVRVRGRLVPTPARTNVVVSVARVSSFETDQVRDGADLLISPGDGTLAVNPTNQFRMSEEIEVRYVAGDGTVPIGSLARGHGSSLDFNAPHARLHPLVGSFNDEVTGHNPMLNADAFLDLFAEIYAGRPIAEVALVISPPDQLNEGQLASLTVTGTPPPGTAGGLSYVLDFGDGAVELHKGRFGESVSVPHRYRQSGTYLVTVGAATDNGIYGLTSSRVAVANVAPVVEIEGGNFTVNRGETRVLVAKVKDAGLDDRHTFSWTLAGRVVSGLNQFAAPVTFDEPGTQTVGVRVTDSDGAETDASVTVTVRAEPTNEAGANFGLDSAPGDTRIRRAELNGFEGGHPEIIVRVHGHAPDALDTVGVSVRQVGPDLNLLGGFFGAIVEAANPGNALAGLGNALYERVILPRVSRFLGRSAKDTDFARQQRELPEAVAGINLAAVKVQVGARGRGSPLEVDVLYLEGGTPKVLRRWQVAGVATNEGVRLTFDWITLEGTLDRVAPLLSGSPLDGSVLETIPPSFSAAGEQAAGDRSGPATIGILNPATDRLQILGRDNLTAATNLTFFAVFDANENGRLDDDIFYPLETNVVQFARLPKRPFAIVAVDQQGNVGSLDPFHIAETKNFLAEKLPGEDRSVYEQKLKAIRDTVRQSIREAQLSPVIAHRFLLAPTNLWVFEQGSGANLWKADFVRRCNGVYLPGKSDNDYELFLPVHLATPYDFTEADRARFERDGPHEPATLTGDWYFKRPTGLDGAGVATLDDAAIAAWEYQLPVGFPLADGQTSFRVERRASDNNLADGFRSPFTPAEVIARVFTLTITGNTNSRKLLPDTTFFPERREHFMFGHLHLQRPPEFGDDPIGDGGTGRQLLLLKWLLEGAFVTLSDGGDGAGDLNLGAPTLSQVFTNWQHAGVPLAEGLEWGVFQDFAALKARPFQVASVRLSSSGAADQLRILQRSMDDAVAQQQASRIKKLGKSAIRAALARLAGDTNLNALVAGVPASRLTNNSVRSFEHVILELARSSAEARAVFGDFANDRDDRTEPPDLGDFLRAKNGDRDYLATIINEPGSYERFVTNTFLFLRNFVQRPTESAYRDYLRALPSSGQGAELNQRVENLAVTVNGAGALRPGLRQLNADRRLAAITVPVSLEVYGPGSLGLETVRGTFREGKNSNGSSTSPRGIVRADPPGEPTTETVAEVTAAADEDKTLRDQEPVTDLLLKTAVGENDSLSDLDIDVVSRFPDESGEDNTFTAHTEIFPRAVPAPLELPALDLILGLFTDSAGQRPVPSFPEDFAKNQAASAGRYLRKDDQLFVRFQTIPGLIPGSLLLQVTNLAQEKVGFTVPLVETAPLSGLYTSVTGLRVIGPESLQVTEEDTLEIRVVREGREVASTRNVVDVLDVAGGGLDRFYAQSDQELVRDFARLAGGNVAADTVFANDLGGANEVQQFRALVRNFGELDRGFGEADFLLLASHGLTSGKLVDDRNNTLWDPAVHFTSSFNWDRDADWAILASCNQLSPPEIGNGSESWRHAFDSPLRPVHGLLGAWKPLPADLRPELLDFLGEMLEGVPYLAAYRDAMENAGPFARPWAALMQQTYTTESFTALLPDRLRVEDLVYRRSIQEGGLTACPRGPDGTPQPFAEPETMPVWPRIGARITPLLAVREVSTNALRVSLRRPGSYQVSSTGIKPRPVNSAAGARDSAVEFFTTCLPALSSRVRWGPAAPEVETVLRTDGSSLISTNRYSVPGDLVVGQVPVWRSRIMVAVTPAGVDWLTVRHWLATDEPAGLPATPQPWRTAHAEVARQLGALGWTSHAVLGIQLAYADPKLLGRTKLPAAGLLTLEPFWCFTVQRGAEQGGTDEPVGYAWVNALTGEWVRLSNF